MRSTLLTRGAPLLVAAVLSAGTITACARNRDYYDSTHNDRHRWNSQEDAAYRRWESERSMNHVDYSRRDVNDQNAYWAWRHEHPDR